MSAAPMPDDPAILTGALTATIKSLERAIADLTAERPDRDGAATRAKDAIESLEKVLAAKPRAQRAYAPGDVLDTMAADGPLVHEPTGLAGLDDATMGGPVYGSRWYIQGAPDAGKTALLVQIAHELAMRGVVVGLLAVDEEPVDILTRLAQRTGFNRIACERRGTGELAAMRLRLGALPIRMYGIEWTIEAAARDVAQVAAERGARAMLGIDSIQVVRCTAELLSERELSETQAIGLRVQAIRASAQDHRMIVMATSEMSRAAYRAINRADRIDPMAAAKWSGAIEYSARVMLALRSVKGAPDTIELEVPKNKHGRRRYASEGDALYLAIDRARQTLEECDAPPDQPDDGPSEEQREAAEDAKVQAMMERILVALLKANAKGARLTSREDLRSLVPGGNDIKAKAVSRLISSGRIEGGRGRPFVPARTEDDGEA